MDPGSGQSNVTELDSLTCEELPPWGVPLGILMGIAGSVGINVGQNLQAGGLAALPEEQRSNPCRSRIWIVGQAVFIAFSLLNFAALALAPSSVLMPLESIQFITNIVYNRFVNHKLVTRLMLAGVISTLVGTVLSVVFGAPSSGCRSLADLESFWTGNPLWWLFMGSTLSIAAVAHGVRTAYDRRIKAGGTPWGHQLVLPITFTLSSALTGGSQMIAHSKAFSELLAMLLQGDLRPLTSWVLYVGVLRSLESPREHGHGLFAAALLALPARPARSPCPLARCSLVRHTQQLLTRSTARHHRATQSSGLCACVGPSGSSD